MDFSRELKTAVSGMSVENATKMAAELRLSIEARESKRICACGTPCRNYRVHDAVDNLSLIEMEKIIEAAK